MPPKIQSLPPAVIAAWMEIAAKRGRNSSLAIQAMPIAPVYVVDIFDISSSMENKKSAPKVSPPKTIERLTPHVEEPEEDTPLPDLADDETLQLMDSPMTPVIIGCLGDGSCFFHALLKALSPTYQMATKHVRVTMAERLRADMATILPKPWSASGKSVYATIAGGSFPELAESGVVNTFVEDDPINYSLASIVGRIGDPTKFVGDEAFSLASLLLNIGVLVMRLKKGKLEKYVATPGAGLLPDLWVILLYGGEHYEIVAAARKGGLQTCFKLSDFDPFLNLMMGNAPKEPVKEDDAARRLVERAERTVNKPAVVRKKRAKVINLDEVFVP